MSCFVDIQIFYYISPIYKIPDIGNSTILPFIKLLFTTFFNYSFFHITKLVDDNFATIYPLGHTKFFIQISIINIIIFNVLDLYV